ncbi:MAG: head GIN domain-containing protein [Flavobacteriaceae bacterium]
MKKLIALVVFVSLSLTTVQAQWFNKRIRGNNNMKEVTRNVGNFDGVSVGGSFDVKLVAGKEGKVTIHAEENLIPYLITEVRDNTLKIKWKKGISVNSHKRILVAVPFKEISKVALAGSGDVFTENSVINTDKLKVSLAGSGNIKLAVKAMGVKTSIAGSGDIYLNGTTDSFKASIAGSGDIHAFELKAKTSNLSIAGSGGIRTSTSDMLKVSIAGSGDVYYKGNPKEDARIAGSGSLRSKND